MTVYRDADEARRQIERWAAVGRDQQARAVALQSAVQAVRVEHRSPARDVRVVVDASGLLQELELTERALDASALELGRTIVATLGAARAALAARLDEVADEVGGSQDPALLASFREQHVQTLLASLVPPAERGGRSPLVR
jgi:hypothetical protein